jgi:probable rRNA maturation factor
MRPRNNGRSEPVRPVAVQSRHPRLRFRPAAVARALRVLDRHRPQLAAPGSVLENAAEISVVFLTDPELARLHGEFLADPSPTDVITFPGPAPFAAGEICVSVDAARRRAGRDFAAELTLYLAHGWLHLAGHDDRRPDRKRRMRRAEARALRALRAAGAMPSFSLASGPAKTKRPKG